MAVANVVAKFEADISDVQAKMAALKKSFADAGDSAQSMSNRMKAVGEGMSTVGRKMTLGVTLPLAAIGAASVKASMDFETSMSKIEGLVGVASDEVASMGQTIMETSAQFGVGADEAANALFFITSAGLRGADAMNVLEASMKASQIGLGDVATVADLATSAMNAYGPEVLSATAATDVLTTAVREGKLEASELAGSMGRVLPIASAMGVRFDEVGAAMAAMSRTGTNASEASTQLRGILAALLRPTTQAEEALAGMGLSADGLRTQLREDGLLATLQTLSERFQGNDAAAAQVFGNVRALAGVMDLMGANSATTSKIFDSLTESTGATDKAFAVTSDTAQFRLNQALAEMKTALIEIGNVIMPVATTMLDFAKSAMQAFNSLPGPIKKVAVTFGAIVAALGPILWIAGKVISTLGALSAAFLATKTKAMGAMRTMAASVRGSMDTIRLTMWEARASMGLMGATAKTTAVTVGAAFRGMGTAVKGFLSALGPVGLAIAGATFAFEAFGASSRATEEIVGELRDEVDLTRQSLTQMGAEIVAIKLHEAFGPENIAALEEYGISMAELVDGVVTGGQAFDDVRARMVEFRNSDWWYTHRMGASDLIAQLDITNNAVRQTIELGNAAAESREIAADRAAAAEANMTSATVAAAVAAGNAMKPTQEFAQSLDQVTDAAGNAVTELDMMQQEYSAWLAVTGQISAVDTAAASIDKLGESAVEFGTDLMGQTPKARDFRADVIKAFEDSASAAQSLSDDMPTQRAIFTGELIKIVASLRASGVKPRDIEAFLGAMDDLPASVSDIMRSAAKAIGDTDFKTEVEKAFDKSVKAGAPMTADAMEQLAKGASDAAKSELGLTLEPQLASIIKSGTSALRPTAFNNGELTGKSIGSGLATGISRSSPIVQAAVARVVAQAKAAADAAAESQSPSRLFARTGDDMSAGVAMGWTRSAPKIYAAVRSSVPRAKEEGNKLANALAKGFAEALANAGGSIASAINEVFGSIPTKTPLERILGSEDAEKFIKNNTKALQALAALGDAFDMIAEKVSFAASAITALAEATARPFGRPSDLMEIFGSESDIDGVIDGYLNLAQTLTDSFSVLTDASIVGDKAAKANRANLRSILKQLEGLTRRAIALREEYEANLEALAKAEEDYARDVESINARYDELDREAAANIKAIEDRWAAVIPGLESAAANARAVYERENTALQSLISERDGFLKQIADGARSFLNSLSFTKRKAEGAAKQAVPEKQIIETVQTLANGIRVITKREVTPAAEAIAEAVEEPLSAVDIRSSLEARLADLRAFSQNIRTLVARGLDPALVKQFVSAGVSGAGEAAAALAAGSADEISAINSVQNALAAEVAEFGQYAADEWHNAAIAQQEAVVGAALTQQQIAERALAQANKMRADELKAAQDFAQALKDQRQADLVQREAEYEAEKARLEARNRNLQAQMDAIAQLIQNWMSRIAGRLPQQTEDAGQDAARKLLNGFRKAYPDVFDKLNKLMDQLARSMNRVVTVTVRTVYEATGSLPKRALGGPVQARTAYLVGERGPEVFVPYGNGNIIPNNALGSVPSMGARAAGGGTAVININVNAGMGADGAEIGRHIVDSLRQYERRNGPIPVSVTG